MDQTSMAGQNYSNSRTDEAAFPAHLGQQGDRDDHDDKGQTPRRGSNLQPDFN